MHKAEIEEQGNYRDPCTRYLNLDQRCTMWARCGYKELAERLEEDDALSNLPITTTPDENGIFNVDVNVDEIEIETEESHGGGKTLKIKVLNTVEEE